MTSHRTPSIKEAEIERTPQRELVLRASSLFLFQDVVPVVSKSRMLGRQIPVDTVEDFQFWLPVEKAEVVVDHITGKQIRKIQGVASTADEDLQGETIHQRGLDFKYFLKHGYFNNDHKVGFLNKVGEPTKAEIRNNRFWVEGFLYNNHNVADEIWNLMHAQEKTPNATRKVGFSVQGKVKRRMGKQILDCWVQDVAITTAPINTKTWAQVSKSLNAQEWVEDVDRALTTGYAITNQTDGATLRPQSLGPKITKLTYDGQVKKTKKSLSIDEAVEFLQLQTGYSRSTSRLIVNAHLKGVI